MIGWARFEVKASTQWAMASTPVAAVTIGGTETVRAGSMIAMSASICDALGRDLVHRRRVGDQRAGADLAAGAGRRRDLDQRDAALRRAVRARRCRAGACRSRRGRRRAWRDPWRCRRRSRSRRRHRPPSPRRRRPRGSAGRARASPRRRARRSRRPRMSRRAAFTLSATTKGRRTPVASSQAARVSTWPAPKRTIAGRCISIGVLQGSAWGLSSGDGEPAGLLDLGVGVEAGGEQAAGVGLLRGSRRSRGRCRSRRRWPFSMTITWSAKSRHHRQVVGDEDEGDAELALELVEQRDHLRLDRDVEGGDRLVGDDELGLERQRAGDGDALALAAGELVRVALRVLGREADLGEELGDALAPAAPSAGSRGGSPRPRR